MIGRIVVVAALTAATGCTSASNTSTTSPSATETPTTTFTSTPTLTTMPSPATSSASLAEGRNFGYIKSFDTSASPHTFSFDLAYFYTGDAANKAAREDGVIGPTQTVDNDYYIRNKNPKLVTLALLPSVSVAIVDWGKGSGTKPSALAPFEDSFKAGADNSGTYHGPTSQYWVTVSGGVVTKIEEQFLP